MQTPPGFFLYAKECETMIRPIKSQSRDLRSHLLCVINRGMRKSQQDVLPVSTPTRTRRHRLGRIRFFALRDGIRQCLDAGYSLILTYEEHEERLGMSYSQFVRYVSRFITPDVRGPTEILPPQPGTVTVQARPLENTGVAIAVAVNVEVLTSQKPASVGQPRFVHHTSVPKDKLV